MDKVNANIIRGHLETMVLSVIEQEESHGFEIMRRLENEGVGMFRMQEGTLYPVLYRLESAALVEARWEDGAVKRRGPRRRIYRLTKKGIKELARRREEWRQFVSVASKIIGVPPNQQGE